MRAFGVWVVAAALAFGASAAWAQAGAVGIGGGGGAVIPVGDLDDLYNSGPGWSFWASVGMLENLEIRSRIERLHLDQRAPEPEGFPFGDGFDLTLQTLTFGPRVFLLDSVRWFRPWAEGGLGWTRVEADDAGPDNTLRDDDRFHFDLGAGFDVGQPRWALEFGFRYFRSLGSGDEEDLAWLAPMGGFTFRFLP